ncbi:MAG: 4Fe-4S binding protein [Clostridiales Family XIII bacterium]|jgi:Fe-S-cluster-containing hydrogenase component 2|nr:4Fe-4S binding protein [Clostridiales Family XIII bacterium]
MGNDRHIIQYDQDISLCSGCSGCEVVCGLIHERKTGPAARRIFVHKDSVQMIHTVYTCQQCAEHPCFDACPKKIGAMQIDEATGIVYVDQEKCIGCGLCVKACPFEPKRMQVGVNKKAQKCDLCRDRAEGPACIAECQVMCLGMSDEPIPAVK